MRIMTQLPDFDTTHEVTNNPEILLMMAQQDDPELDVIESLWVSGQAVTKPKSSHYE